MPCVIVCACVTCVRELCHGVTRCVPPQIQQVLAILPFFTTEQAAEAIASADGNVETAINRLLST